jgi:adenosylmethionine-8-amino-7-oxononanoate aminotransferase
VHPFVQSPRVLGTLAAFELGSDSDDSMARGAELAEFALAQGVLLLPLGNTVYVLPPYCMSTQDLLDVYAVIGMFLEARC